MKNKIFIAIFIIMGLYIFSQAAVDIFDPLYEDIRIWENIGLLNDIPQLRPYPLQEIKRILNIVIEKGDAQQKKTAQDHYNRFFSRKIHFGARTELNMRFPKKDQEFVFSPFVDINAEIFKYITVSGNANVFLTNKIPSQSPQPAFQYSKHDISEDGVYVGKFFLLPVFNTGTAVGTHNYYLSAAIARTDFGPFDNSNIFIGSQAMHQGQFNFVANQEKWTYTQTLLTLTAKNDLRDGYTYPNKFLTLHSLNFRPLPWLSIGIVDSIIYGGRFEPIYLLPFSAYFISQGLYGFPDNSLIGGMFTIKPIRGLRIDGALYSDDIGFNEIVKFKKDAKWRISGQFGVSYTMPKTHWFTLADINYTFVTPYCYTHFDNGNFSKPNNQNYTHNGSPLGSNLQPNSDRIRVKIQFRPLEGFSINIANTFIRHGNVTESVYDPVMLKEYLLKGTYSTDGSIFNHSAATTGEGTETKAKEHAFLYSTPFLTQQTIQYINQLGLEGVINLPILKSGGLMQFKFGYTFETNINPGVNRNIYNEKIDFSGLNEDQIINKTINEANKQLKKWREAAKGKEFNHYFNIGVKISY